MRDAKTKEALILAHIVLMSLGWLLFLPAGISIAALGRDHFPSSWFAFHRGLQVRSYSSRRQMINVLLT